MRVDSSLLAPFSDPRPSSPRSVDVTSFAALLAPNARISSTALVFGSDEASGHTRAANSENGAVEFGELGIFGAARAWVAPPFVLIPSPPGPVTSALSTPGATSVVPAPAVLGGTPGREDAPTSAEASRAVGPAMQAALDDTDVAVGSVIFQSLLPQLMADKGVHGVQLFRGEVPEPTPQQSADLGEAGARVAREVPKSSSPTGPHVTVLISSADGSLNVFATSPGLDPHDHAMLRKAAIDASVQAGRPLRDFTLNYTSTTSAIALAGGNDGDRAS